jgi:hypothetical protein
MIGWYEIGLEPKYRRTIFPGTSPSVGFCDIESKRRKAETAEPADCLRVLGLGLGIGLALGLSMRDSMIGGYFEAALMWALGSIAAVGRIRKNRRFARIDATGVGY